MFTEPLPHGSRTIHEQTTETELEGEESIFGGIGLTRAIDGPEKLEHVELVLATGVEETH